MFQYDIQSNMLEICKTPRKKPSDVYEESESYLSYKEFVHKTIVEDIAQLLIPKLNEIVKGTPDFPYIWLEKCMVNYDNTSTYKGYEYNSVFVSLGTQGYLDGGKPFCIFKIPLMDPFGVIRREGKDYALLSELVQDDDITYSKKNGLKVITERAYIGISKSTSKLTTKYKNKEISTISILIAMCEKEGINTKEIVQKLKSLSKEDAFQDEQAILEAIEWEPAKIEVSGILEAFQTENYNVSKVRNKMNRVLSIDRAIGKVLSRDIVLKNGEIIEAETLITASVMRKLKHNLVNEVYVSRIPNMEGYYIADRIYLSYLRKGTKIIEVIQKYFPGIKGAYLGYDLKLEQTIIIEEDEQVTKDLLELLAYNGLMMITLKPGVHSSVRVPLPFEVEIIGNNHFRESDVGGTSTENYFYINPIGEFEASKKQIVAYDIIAMVSLMNALQRGEDFAFIADKDVGLRKKVYQAKELFHNAFLKVLPDFTSKIKRSFETLWKSDPSAINDPDKMETKFYGLEKMWWSALYQEMKVIAPIDHTNPVAFHSSLTKVVSVVKDANSITGDMRQLTMGHYGRLDPYETPQSKRMGVVNNKAIGCRIINGIMHTTYQVVKHVGSDNYLTDDCVLLTAEQEEVYRIADISSLRLDCDGKILNTGFILARVPTTNGLEKMSAAHVSISKIDLVNVDPNQHLSLAATTIPFIGANDSIRVTFALGMVKQAKGLLSPEIPRVLTSGFKEIPRSSTYFQIHAEYDGVIADILGNEIIVYYPEIDDSRSYEFRTREFTSTSVIIREIHVTVGQEVKSGEILVSSNFTKDGILAMGINALIAFIPVGFNYEDGVFASQRLCHKLTSYGANKEVEKIPKNYTSTAIGYIDKFRYMEPGSTIYKLKHATRSKVVTREIISNKLKGFMVDVVKELDSFSKKDSATKAYSVSFDYLKSGDKLANRHGNKGVTPILESNKNMPCFMNGEFIDIAYNPAGVVSRMNIGQELEANLGLACLVLDIYVCSDAFNGASLDDIKMLLSYAWSLANEEDTLSVIKRFNRLPPELHQHSMEQINRIKGWKNSFNEDGTAWLHNPRTGKKFETPVVVGVNYIYKLVHEVAKKVHARAGYCSEPYIEKTDAPTKSSANLGGQKYGTMEMDAFSAYGASSLIQEIMNERGDNAVARNNLTVAALHKGDTYKLDESTAIRRSTEYFVNIMECLGVHMEFMEELPNSTKEEIKKKRIYSQDTLLLCENIEEDKSGLGSMSLRDFSDELGGF